MVLVDQVCSSIWASPSPRLEWPAGFGRLVSLLGKVTRIVKWDDGDGKASIGHRRDLANQQILVGFGLPESSGYWYEIKIGKKIQVDESSSFPVVAFLGEEWNSRVVVEARSRDAKTLGTSI